MTDKEAQLKAKLLKMRLAEQKKWSATGLSPEEVQKVRADHEKRRKYMKLDPTKNKNKVTESDFQSGNFEIKDAKSKVKKLKKKYVDPNPQAETPEEIMQSAESAGREPTYIAQEHGHRISFRGHPSGNYKTASLNEQSGKYAKYWLLNAKDTNGNGWGIAAHTAKDNMKKFIGRPLVVTASSWHGASEYGDEYEHPYLPTNDINSILNHQEKFRVGSIVDVVEDSHGDWYANVEMLPKFASSRLPPFCSPAIYQLDASEAEGQISKWEALHLAALTENPAYGARIALLKGTCVGTGSECKVQFKVAKQEATTVCSKKKQKISKEDPTEKVIREVKDPEKKKDLLNRLDEKPNEYGPKNYGGTKRKDFGKRIGKLKQRLAGVDWSSVQDEDFFTKPYKTPPVEYSKEYGFSAMDHISNLHDESSYNAGQNAMEKFKGLSHPLSRKFAFEAMDNHLYNSSLMIQNNYPDIEDIVGNNDKDSLYNILEGHSADTLEHANYRIEDKFGFGEESPQPQNEGEELGRALFEPFERMKDEEYAQIPDRKGDMLKTKDIINEYTNDVSGGIMKSFGKYTKHPLQAKLRISKLKQRLAAVEQQKLALITKPVDVLKAFKNYKLKPQDNKGLKSFDDTFKPLYTKNSKGTRGLLTDGKNLYYSGHTDSKTGKFVPHKIAEHTSKGIRVSNAGYDSKTTYKYLRELGIHTNQVKGQRFINKKPYNAQAGKFVTVPYGDISDKPIVFNPGKSSGNRSIVKQRSFSEGARKRTTGNVKDIPESPTAIQPRDQRMINKITGVKGKIPSRRVLGTETDHIFQRSKYPKMEGLSNNALPIDPPSHHEKHFPQSTIPRSFYSKLKARLAGIKVWGTDEAPRDDPRDPDLCLDCGEFNESHYVDEGSDELRGHPFNPPSGPQDKAERIIRKQNNPENKITKKDLKRRIANIYENEDGRITLSGDEDEVLDSTLRQISQGGVDASKYKHKPERYYPKRTRQQLKKRDKIVGDVRLKGMMDLNQDSGMTGTQEFEDTFNMETMEDRAKSTNVLGQVRKIKMKNKGRKGTSLAKLKLKLANLGEQNMTYQDSKKVKIHKKKNMEKHDKA